MKTEKSTNKVLSAEEQSEQSRLAPVTSGYNFREIREAKKMTLRDVETVTGISNAYLSQLETGKIKKPSFYVIDTLNKFYGLTQQPRNVDFDYKAKANEVLQKIFDETMRAKTLFPEHFVNQHEAYAVLLEETDELWDEIKKNQRIYDLDAQRKEATQAAAMLVRLLVELL